jgi:alkylation response protein AidB-like acyl-CoA dehydrogenase
VAEELPSGESLGFALAAFVQANLIGPLLKRLGTRRQREEWLAPLIAGRILGAMAVTEAQAGSDVTGVQTIATRSPNGFVLTGEKTYITAASVADLLIVAATSTIPASRETISLFLVPARTPGVTVDRMKMLGLNTSGPARIRLSDVQVSRDRILGAEGDGFAWVLDGLTRERLFGGLGAVAWAGGALARARAWARERSVFGRTLSTFQTVRHRFAELETTLEAARQLNYATFRRWVDGGNVAREVAMIKVFSYRAAADAIDACVQIHGAAGYVDAHWASRYYRDARALSIAAGTPEVMNDIIAAYLKW